MVASGGPPMDGVVSTIGGAAVVAPTTSSDQVALDTSATSKASRRSDLSPSVSDLQPPSKKAKNDPPGPIESTTILSASNDVLPSTAATSLSAPAPAFGDSNNGTVPQSQQNLGYQSYAPFSAPPSYAPGSAKGTGALFYKTKLCTKFKIGACTFNERCHFAHGTEDLRKPPPLWETAGGGTPGVNHVGQTRIKTRPCRYFADGNCSFGDRCNFLHGNEELQKTSGTYDSYPATSLQVRPSVSAGGLNYRMQGYSGGPSYPNNATSVLNNAQYSNDNQGYTIPGTYADQNSINSSNYASVPYNNYAAISVAPAVPQQNVNPYASGQVMNPPYASSQDGASVNYNQWAGQGQPATVAHGYNQGNQVNQSATWSHNFSYVKRDNETMPPQYYREQQSQVLNAASHVTQHTQSIGADGGYYHGQYNQDANGIYASRYNVTESWGGMVQ